MKVQSCKSKAAVCKRVAASIVDAYTGRRRRGVDEHGSRGRGRPSLASRASRCRCPSSASASSVSTSGRPSRRRSTTPLRTRRRALFFPRTAALRTPSCRGTSCSACTNASRPAAAAAGSRHVSETPSSRSGSLWTRNVPAARRRTRPDVNSLSLRSALPPQRHARAHTRTWWSTIEKVSTRIRERRRRRRRCRDEAARGGSAHGVIKCVEVVGHVRFPLSICADGVYDGRCRRSRPRPACVPWRAA